MLIFFVLNYKYLINNNFFFIYYIIFIFNFEYDKKRIIQKKKKQFAFKKRFNFLQIKIALNLF